ncbi:MAG TPA: methyltransferase domain-containing protein, partial [Solirubrobacterales bacterium]|nr:methyltransferase domain-containing protein [Solirubrobacterales bacterium]
MSAADRIDALDRARELLTPEAATIAARPDAARSGYLDLIEGDLESTGVTQDLMLTRFVPAIYERYWRPALARIVKGPTGPGMVDEVRIARRLLALDGGDAVLDIACGPGNFSRELARTVGSRGLAVGIDASRTMLARGVAEISRSELANLALIRADAGALPFRAGSFDAVCCFAALHLFADPFGALDEMRRMLAAGGRIALMTSVRRRLTPRRLKPVIERASGIRVFEHDEITSALDARGFTEIDQSVA